MYKTTKNGVSKTLSYEASRTNGKSEVQKNLVKPGQKHILIGSFFLDTVNFINCIGLKRENCGGKK
jgi:hypothetical protein